MRLRARTDANHAAIVQALRQVGCAVADLSQLGSGIPDLLVCRQRELWLIEVKTAKGKQTKDQLRFEALGWPVYLVRSSSEALAVVGIR